MTKINNNTQSGSALIVSLIILISMTMLGVTSMKIASTELSMAGNLRESGITFQAAEAGLRAVEAILQQGNDPAGLLAETTADPDYFDTTVWTNATVANITLAGITQNPRYIVKYLGLWNPDANVSAINPGFSGYGQTSNAITIDYYRATSRGVGVTGNTSRTVQSFYGRR